jgi:hypothetical protein
MYMCSKKFNLDCQQLSNLEISPIESSQETLKIKEALKALDKEISHEAIEGHDVAGEGADRFGIVVAESSPVNDHEQQVSDEEHEYKGLLLQPPSTQFNDRFQRDRQAEQECRLADCRATKCIRAGLVRTIIKRSFALHIIC